MGEHWMWQEMVWASREVNRKQIRLLMGVWVSVEWSPSHLSRGSGGLGAASSRRGLSLALFLLQFPDLLCVAQLCGRRS
jgi:hypothetical protein